MDMLTTLYDAKKDMTITYSIFSGFQVGLSRSTTGCVAACLFREFQLAATYEGLIETVPGVNADLLRMDKYELDPKKDTLFRGEFEVVKELIAALPDGAVSILILILNANQTNCKSCKNFLHAGRKARMRQGH